MGGSPFHQKKLTLTKVGDMRGTLLTEEDPYLHVKMRRQKRVKVLETIHNDLGQDVDIFLTRFTHTQWTYFQNQKLEHRIK